MKYADFVDYSKLDPFKKKIVKCLAPTFKNLFPLGINVVKQSLGEPAVLLDFKKDDFYLAFKSDGVGTKNKIADAMLKNNEKLDPKKLYAGFGFDLLAMNANDLICLGATPLALSDEVASGDSSWFENEKMVEGLLLGLKKGCNMAGVTIPCGETPTLQNIIYPDSVTITGAMIGIIRPKSQAIFGQNLKAGDTIFGLLSNGIHSNGLTLARRIVEKLTKGYLTSFGVRTIGEELLKPTQIYVKPVLEMVNKGIEIHYMSHISGSAFKKIMRAKKPFTYLIDQLPKKPKILAYLQKLENIPDQEAYETWNMGLGFAIYAPLSQERKIKKICQKYKVGFLRVGQVVKGPKQVVIKPLNIVYKD